MPAELLVLVVLPALLALAAGWDLGSYTIPNVLQGALIAAFVVFVFVAGMTPGMVGDHLLAGFLGLIVGFILFALGYIGGGDAKLFACVVLWLGFRDLVSYALAASLLGGALTLVLLGLRRLPLPAALARQNWLLRLHDERSGIPYGAALAAGAFVILPQTEIFRLAAGL
ncbi:MAG: prepilin peptidase [Alphaproteobacteria bacterium]|nr:prepilin peptidase [Alphaproteobacteria bacterium]MDE2112793.1 prepilin peptidase [Alphaproteobacteria bacterium]MDE2493306.1 prepilin peptidase [Alphaproteobacteria bacterium]